MGIEEHPLLRRAVIDDAGAVTRIARAAYEKYVPVMGHEPAPMLTDYAKLIGTCRVWIADRGGQPLGFVVTRPMPGYLLLENIAVAPEAQNRGIGVVLLERAELDAIESGRSEIRLYTNAAMTENLAYYPRHGYVETHRATDDGYHRVFFTKLL